MIQSSLLVGFYFFAAISIYLGILSLRGGIRFVRYLRSESSKRPGEFTPFVSIFFPLRGLDEGLNENMAAVLSQDYPSYEVIFVSDDENDPARHVLAETRAGRAELSVPAIRTVIAGPASDRGQKVHNLSVAVSRADPTSGVFVFVDSDARPNREWLRNLVAPLRDETIGAATGYRWFVPAHGGVASHLRSVWNAAIASALGADEKKNFCWGGSTAIRRSTFEKCQVTNYWRGTVSDDFAITRALHDADLPIRFVPQCLTPSIEDCSLHELVEFTTRQLKITRAYAAHLWKAVLFGSLIFVITFFGGIAVVITRALNHLSIGLPLFLLFLLFVMGAIKSYLRQQAVSKIVRVHRVNSLASRLAHGTLWPIASALYLCNALAAAVSRRITWRGITYELNSPNETVIIRKQESGVRSRESE